MAAKPVDIIAISGETGGFVKARSNAMVWRRQRQWRHRQPSMTILIRKSHQLINTACCLGLNNIARIIAGSGVLRRFRANRAGARVFVVACNIGITNQQQPSRLHVGSFACASAITSAYQHNAIWRTPVLIFRRVPPRIALAVYHLCLSGFAFITRFLLKERKRRIKPYVIDGDI